MIRDLVAIVDTSDRDEQFVADAVAFADFHHAHLCFILLSTVPTPDYMLVFEPPFVLLDEYVRRSDAKRVRLESAIRQIPGEVRIISGEAEDVLRRLAVHARYADLALIGAPENYASDKLHRKVAEAVMLWSGRPLLSLPAGTTPRPFDRLALGWNASREATHALKDALALLTPGAAIDVVVVDGVSSKLGHGSEPGADIAGHLARHGYRVAVHEVAADPTVADTLIRVARSGQADLLAIGGYARSRLSEMILGGVTRDLLRQAELPCLFSH